MDKNFTIIKTMGSQMEAQMLCNMLKANGIEAHSRGTKEYASHITGADHGHYEIVVPENEIEKAQELILEIQESELTPSPVPASRYLQGSLLFAVGGLFLYPFIFGAVSLFNLWGYWKREAPGSRKILWTLVTILVNALALSIYFKMWSSI